MRGFILPLLSFYFSLTLSVSISHRTQRSIHIPITQTINTIRKLFTHYFISHRCEDDDPDIKNKTNTNHPPYPSCVQFSRQRPHLCRQQRQRRQHKAHTLLVVACLLAEVLKQYHDVDTNDDEGGMGTTTPKQAKKLSTVFQVTH